jgi:hypothetical protein
MRSKGGLEATRWTSEAALSRAVRNNARISIFTLLSEQKLEVKADYFFILLYGFYG